MSLPLPDAAEVLIVEDEGPIAQVIAAIVEDCGYIPLVATNGKEALHFLREHRPRLIITDLMMPHINGAEMIQSLRGSNTNIPPIILVSAAGEHHLREARADVTLGKPFEVPEIEALLHRFLDASWQ